MTDRVIKRPVGDGSPVYCPDCGHANPPSASFCMACGADLSIASPSVQSADKPAPYGTRYDPRYEGGPRRGMAPGAKFAIVAILVAAVLIGVLAGTGVFRGTTAGLPLIGGNNSNAPSYIKQLTLYKEGSQAFGIYFILADSTGAMTTADGEATLAISETDKDYVNNDEYEWTLFTSTFSVSKDQFVNTKVGQGAFEHDALLFPIGRLAYTQFTRMPSKFSGVAYLTFKTKSGAELKAEETILFDQ